MGPRARQRSGFCLHRALHPTTTNVSLHRLTHYSLWPLLLSAPPTNASDAFYGPTHRVSCRGEMVGITGLQQTVNIAYPTSNNNSRVHIGAPEMPYWATRSAGNKDTDIKNTRFLADTRLRLVPLRPAAKALGRVMSSISTPGQINVLGNSSSVVSAWREQGRRGPR